MRVRAASGPMTLKEADILCAYLKRRGGVVDAAVYDRTGDAVISYSCRREDVVSALAAFSFDAFEYLLPQHSTRQLNREYEDKLFFKLAFHFAKKAVLPAPIKSVLTAFKVARYALRGLKSLSGGQLKVEALDAAAVGVSFLRGDAATARSVMLLLEIGDILETWTHKRSVADLADAMSLGVDRVFIKRDGTEEEAPLEEVEKGDIIAVRMGGMIPLDGIVESGEAMVNQASLTGEPLPVRKAAGSYVYAGTVVAEGHVDIRVEKTSGSGRYDRIVKMIDESQRMKSGLEAKAERLADRLVPYSLLGTAAVYIFTGNVTKAVSVLMVDYSCALKLSMPLSVLAAMGQAQKEGITVKGGRFMEAAAEAETVIFDKTGTLTYAKPKVAGVVLFGGSDEDEAIRLAACLEEHFPHSMAAAVVEEAKRRGLSHEERHAEVEYVVAHGIASSIDGKKAVIGSRHFVLEDEGCTVEEGEEALLEGLPPQYSHLYLAVGGKLEAVLCIEDPIREEAPRIVAELKKLGIGRVVMLTGDNEKTAAEVAGKIGVDDYMSEVLPEDKADYVMKEHAAGRKVIMIGDGINDSPALSEADVGVAVSTGASIAFEIADVTINGDSLEGILALRALSEALMERIRKNYRKIIFINTLLIALGVAGAVTPAASALMHNASTIAIAVSGMAPLPYGRGEKQRGRSE